MSSELAKLKEESLKFREFYQPEFFRLSIKDDKIKFDELIKPGLVFVFDEISDQLKELIKSRHPSSRFEADDYAKLIDKHLAGVDIDDYGVWVYYPWSKRIVHILDEEEFIELRTSANKHKITTAERNILAGKKVGVIGLSVGQSVSVTMAMERSCGELRLADFDTLELNNLNRIRTGVHNLGLLKAYSVAREIAELDPFFKVVCYTDGITDENIDDFFLRGGKLDAVIDECDGVNIKILCRIKARELNVPVLMEASDRGTLDIERFDLEPDRPIMHGWLQHLNIDLDILKNLKTNAEKLPYMLPIAGLETLSSRMKASMIEMQVTLTTWPQLATAVTLGGAVTADTCRRIFLNQYAGSGRFFIDMEALVPDDRRKEHFEPKATVEITEQEMKEISGKALGILSKASYSPSTEQISDIVAAAIKAPSASNSQPWKWYYREGYLFLFYSDTGIVSFGDFEMMASDIAFGAAIENAALAAHAMGLDFNVDAAPVETPKVLVAVIRFDKKSTDNGLYRPDELVNYIGERVTNRNTGSGKAISKDIFNDLKDAVRSVAEVDLIIKDHPDELAQLANIVGPAERLKLLNPSSHYEFYNKELRWEEDNLSFDGVSIKTLGISQAEEIGLKMVKDPQAANLLAEWSGGQALEYTARKSIASSSGFGLITMSDFISMQNIVGGRAMQRMWLTATKNKISIQPLMAPLLYFARLRAGGNGMPDFMKKELEKLYERFCKLFPEAEERESVFLFRMGLSETPVMKSLRKPIGHVFMHY